MCYFAFDGGFRESSEINNKYFHHYRNVGIPKALSMVEELSKLLYGLARKVIQMTGDGMISTAQVPYLKTKIEDFEYKDGGVNFKSTFNAIVKEEWNLREKFNFLENEVKKLDKYRKAVELIAKRTGGARSQAERNLERFFQRVVDETLSGLSDEDLVSLTSLFTSEIGGAPVLWEPVIWARGITMKADRIKVNENLEIKKPKPSDLEEEIRVGLPQRRGPPALPYPSAIILYRTRAKGQPKVLEEVEGLISLLRLYKLGSVSRIKTEWNPVSILQLGGTSFSLRPKPMPFKYDLMKAVEKKMKRFFERIKPLVSKELISQEGENFLTIAHNRYEDAVTGQGPAEARLLSAIMCLEALYLREKERGELSERLAQRVAVSLNFFGFESVKVRNKIKRGYGIRSSYVHGSKIKKEKRKRIQDLARNVAEYARISLLLHLQLREKLRKEKLISKLDNSLLNEKSRERLGETIKENVEIFP